MLDQKAKTLGPVFKTSAAVDNATGKNWNLPTDQMQSDYQQRKQRRGNTLKTTGDKFLSDKNDYNRFLPVTDPDSWGRLSILQNHKKIMHIMNSNYVKSIEMQKKFHNRNSKDLQTDDEYQQYREDEQNTLKMATILRSLNEPKRKRIEEKRQEIERQRAKKVPKLRVVESVVSPIKTLKEADESDEESVRDN